MVTVKDLPGAITCGDDWEDAYKMGVSSVYDLGDALSFGKQILPKPSPVAEGEVALKISPVIAFKIILRNEMNKRNIRLTDLANKMDLTPSSVRQYLTYQRENTQLSTLMAIAEAIGLKVDVIFEEVNI